MAPEPPLIPAAFAAGVVQAAGDDGRAWLAGLPAVLARLCADWSLTSEEPVRYGYLSLVVPVRRADERLVLRVSRLPHTVAREALALTAWRGRGAVRLRAARPESGALLLERLHGDRSLHDLPITEAVAGLDRGRTRAWSLVRTVDYWLWAVGVGLTRDPVICHRVAAWLAGPRSRG